MEHQRRLYRIALKRSATLQRGHQIVPCQVIDLTEQGVQLSTAEPVEAGEELGLTLELAPAATIHCSVLVTWVRLPAVGARISKISADNERQLAQFIEQLIAINLGCS
ncbi:MAG TPA: PilZ domain-containing protein [Nitrospira sp.]|nr:PilZ domain-containing protein [Nitrospira sp.]